jgi:hypothetical protein
VSKKKKKESKRTPRLSTDPQAWNPDKLEKSLRKAVRKEVRKELQREIESWEEENDVLIAEPPEEEAARPEGHKVEPTSNPQYDIAIRYINTMEEQLRAKDEQLSALDARLSDAYELQRALALLVKRFEISTGISSDVIWSGVSDDDLKKPIDKEEKSATAKAESPSQSATPAESETDIARSSTQTAAAARSVQNPTEKESPADQTRPDNDSPPPPDDGPRSFTDWLRN